MTWRLSWCRRHDQTTSGATQIPFIDLNADLGEHDDDGFSRDLALLAVASSANVACGEHAGSQEVMEQTIENAHEHGVSVGAHPGYPDREGFGRREIGIPIRTILTSYQKQLERMASCCRKVGAPFNYVKPHGALYNRAAKDVELARLIAAATARFDPALTMLTLPGSQLERECREHGLNVAREAFIDRGYMPDGTLVPRTQEGALIEDAYIAASRAVKLARDKSIPAIDGTSISVDPDSLCVHGDGVNALETITTARHALEVAGFTIRAFVS